MAELRYRIDSESALEPVLHTAQQKIQQALKGGPVLVTLGRVKRSNDQNKKLWAMLKDIADQVEWYGQELTKEEWKDVLTAGLLQAKVVPGIDGGFVSVGLSTRKLNKGQFRDLIELIYYFGSTHDVQWSEQAIEDYESLTKKK